MDRWTVLLHGVHPGRFHSPEIPGWSNRFDIRAVVENSAVEILCAANGQGLLRLNAAGWSRLSSAEGLPDDRLASLYIDARDVLWIGSSGGGLFRFKEGKFFQFPQNEAILPRTISGIIEDDLGFLWLASTRGIFRVQRQVLNDFADGAVHSIVSSRFVKSDGLASTECSSGGQSTVLKTRDGRLWFGAINGLSVVDPRHLPFNKVPPKVVIEKVLINGRSPGSGPSTAQAETEGDFSGPVSAVTVPPRESTD